MAFFLIICNPSENHLELRDKVRAKHIEYVEKNSTLVKLAGGLLADDESQIGGFYIIEADNKKAAGDFANNDPYLIEGVFKSFEIKNLRPSRGEWLK